MASKKNQLSKLETLIVYNCSITLSPITIEVNTGDISEATAEATTSVDADDSRKEVAD